MFNFSAEGAEELEEKIIARLATAAGMTGSPRGVLSSDSRTANMLGFIAARQAKLQTSSSFDK